jgi:hypothetical protein
MGIEHLPPVTPGLPDRRGPARPAFPVPTRLPIHTPGTPPRVQPGAPVIEIERPRT